MLRLIIPFALAGIVACAAASEPAPAPPAAAEAAVTAVVPSADVAAAHAVAAPAAAPASVLEASYDAPSDIDCDIYRARTLHGLRLEATAEGFEDSADVLEYEFIVTKRGPGGSSDIMQAGEVSEEALGSVDLSLERGDRFHATLSLRDSDGEVCAAELSS